MPTAKGFSDGVADSVNDALGGILYPCLLTVALDCIVCQIVTDGRSNFLVLPTGYSSREIHNLTKKGLLAPIFKQARVVVSARHEIVNP